MRTTSFFWAAALTLLLSTTSWANTIYVNDSSNNWPGYSLSSTYTSDVIGIPNITNIGFTFSNHSLTSIMVDFNLPTKSNVSEWNSLRIKPGDFFIDINSDKTWDYVIHNPTNLVYKTTGPSNYFAIKSSNVSTTWSVYKTNISYLTKKDIKNTSLYNMSTVFETNQNSYDWRKNHPIQAATSSLKNAQVTDTASVIWPETAAYNTKDIFATWDLGNGLSLSGKTITVAFTVSCANDVFFETFNVPNPEPVSVLLIGAGLAGIACLPKRRRHRM